MTPASSVKIFVFLLGLAISVNSEEAKNEPRRGILSNLLPHGLTSPAPLPVQEFAGNGPTVNPYAHLSSITNQNGETRPSFSSSGSQSGGQNYNNNPGYSQGNGQNYNPGYSQSGSGQNYNPGYSQSGNRPSYSSGNGYGNYNPSSGQGNYNSGQGNTGYPSNLNTLSGYKPTYNSGGSGSLGYNPNLNSMSGYNPSYSSSYRGQGQGGYNN